MKNRRIVGIIAEFNPFHNGHEYLIRQARERFGSDARILVVMSGNYVQRGEPAFLKKMTRCECALRSGADLVLELPVAAACASAEFFAEIGVRLLHETGVVTDLIFGSECGEITPLQEIAKVLANESEAYRNALQNALTSGLSYPAARVQAVMDICPDHKDYNKLLSSPNNLLAIEYLKAMIRIGAAFEAHTLKRVGDGYHIDSRQSTFSPLCSAERIRLAIQDHYPISALSDVMPSSSFALFQEEIASGRYMTPDELSGALLSKLQLMNKDALCIYLDVTPDLADKILRHRMEAFRTTDLIRLLKSKDLTYTRISRALLHILLEITSMEIQQLRVSLPYLHVIGFRKDCADLLSEIKQQSTLPLVTKHREASALSEGAFEIYQKDAARDAIYYQQLSACAYEKSGAESPAPPINPYREQIMIL